MRSQFVIRWRSSNRRSSQQHNRSTTWQAGPKEVLCDAATFSPFSSCSRSRHGSRPKRPEPDPHRGAGSGSAWAPVAARRDWAATSSVPTTSAGAPPVTCRSRHHRPAVAHRGGPGSFFPWSGLDEGYDDDTDGFGAILFTARHYPRAERGLFVTGGSGSGGRRTGRRSRGERYVAKVGVGYDMRVGRTLSFTPFLSLVQTFGSETRIAGDVVDGSVNFAWPRSALH